MCFEYDEDVECQQSCIRKSRKDHRCDCCRGVTIHRGDTYEYRSGIFDGNPYNEKICRRCLYDISRIVDHELADDCLWHTSWPALDDVRDYLANSGMGITDLDKVPDSFDYSDWEKQTGLEYTRKMQAKYPRAQATS